MLTTGADRDLSVGVSGIFRARHEKAERIERGGKAIARDSLATRCDSRLAYSAACAEAPAAINTAPGMR